MKKRNLVIVAFMLVAAMTIGVGYAALSATLTITGDASFHVQNVTDAITEDVYFSNAEVMDGTGGTHTMHNETLVTDIAAVDGTYGNPGNNAVKFTVKTLEQVGQSVTFVYTITNANDANVSADLTLETTSINRSHYGVNIEWEDGSTTPKVIAGNGGTQVVHVTVTLNNISNTGAVDGEVSESFTIGINVSMPSATGNTPAT